MGMGFNDANMIVWDTSSNWFRTWVDVEVGGTNPEPSDVSDDTNQSKYLYGGDTFYRGFRVLVRKTSPAGKWSGNDRNGKSFSQSIVECVTPGTASTAEWVVKYEAKDDLVCVVREEGKSWYYNGSPYTGTWTSMGINATTGQEIKDTDYWHPFDAITEVEGIYQPTSGLNTDSALKVSTEWTTGTLTGNITGLRAKHMAGGWLNFNFPFPHLKQNGTTDVGTWFGGAKTGTDVVCEPATLDIENMHITRKGFRGFSKTVEEGVEEFGQISSIDFWFKLDYQGKSTFFDGVNAGWVSTTEPNIPITVVLVDTSDNMVKQDFTVPFNNQWLPYKLPISGFQTYRARKPKQSIVDTIIPPKEIQMNNQIEWRNIKQIIFQTSTSYDSQGLSLIHI